MRMKGMRMKRLRGLGALGSVAIIVAACGSSASSGKATASSSSSAGGSPTTGARTIELFGNNDLSGPSAPYGTEVQNGALLHVESIDANGGFSACGARYTLKLSSNDDASNAAQSITLAREAAANKNVVAMIGPTPTPAAAPLPALAKAMQLPIMAIGTDADLSPASTYMYRLQGQGKVLTPIVMKELQAKLHFDRLAIIYQSDQGAHVLSKDAEVAGQAAGGYKVVAVQSFTGSDTSFSNQISTVRAANPGLIAIGGVESLDLQILAQLRQAGVTTPVYMGSGAVPLNPGAYTTSHGLLKGAYTWSVGLVGPGAPAYDQKIASDYQAKFNSPATEYAIQGWAGVGAIVAAITKGCTGSDRAKLANALSHLSFQSQTGITVQYNNPPDGNNVKPSAFVTQTTGPDGAYTVIGEAH